MFYFHIPHHHPLFFDFMSFLEKILTKTAEKVAYLKQHSDLIPREEQNFDTSYRSLRTNMLHENSIKNHAGIPHAMVIAEVKKQSPSKGLLRENFNPVEIAQQYQMGHASGISVLTEETFFLGHFDYLQNIRKSVTLPLLRKDFIIDEWQIKESNSKGADAILLIVAALEANQIVDYVQQAIELNLEVLIETHDAREVEVVLDIQKYLPTEKVIMGVNNRNLKTFHTDLNTSLELIPLLQKIGYLSITESAIHTLQDVALMRSHGIDGFLVGESLMRSSNGYESQALCDLFGF
jgi:indole-3-glycerol phosphate synthase